MLWITTKEAAELRGSIATQWSRIARTASNRFHVLRAQLQLQNKKSPEKDTLIVELQDQLSDALTGGAKGREENAILTTQVEVLERHGIHEPAPSSE